LPDAKEWLDAFPALDNKDRFNILIYLSNNGSRSFSDVKKDFSLNSSSTQHHLDKLMAADLITNSWRKPPPSASEKDYSWYELTPRGRAILKKLLE
jgi:predicted transcriptional regulator